MPHLEDTNFAQTLVYLVDHGEQGAMGLVVNRVNRLNLADVLSQLRKDQSPPLSSAQVPILTGGPVHPERGFVLHEPGFAYQATIELGPLSLSTSQDALFAVADGTGPSQYLIALGYAGWDKGQLEQEIVDNVWLTAPADLDTLFATRAQDRLDQAAQKLGVNLALLSAQAGHA